MCSSNHVVLRPGVRATGVKVFAATMADQRQNLGELMTDWMNRDRIELVEVYVLQSSDASHHCLTFTVFYRERK